MYIIATIITMDHLLQSAQFCGFSGSFSCYSTMIGVHAGEDGFCSSKLIIGLWSFSMGWTASFIAARCLYKLYTINRKAGKTIMLDSRSNAICIDERLKMN
jgi:hypothetical protein